MAKHKEVTLQDRDYIEGLFNQCKGKDKNALKACIKEAEASLKGQVDPEGLSYFVSSIVDGSIPCKNIVERLIAESIFLEFNKTELMSLAGELSDVGHGSEGSAAPAAV
jgi:hypothetical protein